LFEPSFRYPVVKVLNTSSEALEYYHSAIYLSTLCYCGHIYIGSLINNDNVSYIKILCFEDGNVAESTSTKARAAPPEQARAAPVLNHSYLFLFVLLQAEYYFSLPSHHPSPGERNKNLTRQ